MDPAQHDFGSRFRRSGARFYGRSGAGLGEAQIWLAKIGPSCSLDPVPTVAVLQLFAVLGVRSSRGWSPVVVLDGDGEIVAAVERSLAFGEFGWRSPAEKRRGPCT